MLRRMPHITSLQWCSTVAGLLAMAVALHGVQLADTADVDVARLETQTVRGWRPKQSAPSGVPLGPASPPRRWCLASSHPAIARPLSCGPSTRGWFGWPSRPGCPGRPGPHAGHLGMQGCTPAARARRTRGPHGQGPGMGMWWCWRVPGQGELLDLVAEDWALLRHRIRESLWRAALLRLEARRPQTSGGGGGD